MTNTPDPKYHDITPAMVEAAVKAFDGEGLPLVQVSAGVYDIASILDRCMPACIRAALKAMPATTEDTDPLKQLASAQARIAALEEAIAPIADFIRIRDRGALSSVTATIEWGGAPNLTWGQLRAIARLAKAEIMGDRSTER